MSQLPPFYAHVIRSYAYVNNIYYESVDRCSLPHNLWCGKLYSHVDKDWVAAGLYTIADLPIVQGKINVKAVGDLLIYFVVPFKPILQLFSLRMSPVYLSQMICSLLS